MSQAKVVFPEIGSVVRVTSFHNKSVVIGQVLENNGTAIVYERWLDGEFCRTRDDCANVRIDELTGEGCGAVAYHTLFTVKAWEADERLLDHIPPELQHDVLENGWFSKSIRARAIELMDERSFARLVAANSGLLTHEPETSRATLERCWNMEFLRSFLRRLQPSGYSSPTWQLAWNRLRIVGGEDAWHAAIQMGDVLLRDPWSRGGERSQDLGTSLGQPLLLRVAREAKAFEVCRAALGFLADPKPIVQAVSAALEAQDLNRAAWLFAALAAEKKIPRRLPPAIPAALAAYDWAFVDDMNRGQGVLDHRRRHYLTGQNLETLVQKKLGLVAAAT
jgi:hypothetical protein